MADEKIYTNIGHVTAYAYAKSKGYTGTEEQFATDQANFAANAQQVREDKESVEATVATFDNTTVPAAVQTVTAEGTRQVGIVGTAGDTQVARVQAEGTTQVGVVQTEGTTQKNAVQAKGDEVIASIPSDYTELTEEVNDLKSSFVLDTEAITGATPIPFTYGTYNTPVDGIAIAYSPSTTCKCARIPVTPGEKVTIHGGAISSTQRLYVFEDSSGNAFGRSLGSLNGTYTVTVPENAVYMCINNVLSVMASGYYAYKGEAIKNIIPRVETAEENISNLQDDIKVISDGGVYSGNLMSGGLISGYYSGTGAIVASNTISHISVNVEGQTNVKVGGFLNNTTLESWNIQAVFFDGLGGVVGTVTNPQSDPYTVDVPEGAITFGINTGFKASDYPSSLPEGLYCSPFVADSEKTFVKLVDLSQGSKKLKMLTGIIRNDGTGWKYIDDDRHEPLNMTSVELTSAGSIVVNYGFTAKKILSLVATPDETFARDYVLGGSVDLSKATFNVYRLPYMIGGLVKYVASTETWDISGANFSSASFDTTTKRLTLTHASLSGSAGSPRNCCNVNGYDCDPRIRSLDYTNIQLIFLNPDGTVMDSPSTNMSFYISRFVPCLFVNANNIVAANGNFWLMGVMEI